MRWETPEGTTPLEDASGLKPTWVRSQEDLNQVEAENIVFATEKYLMGQVQLPSKWFNVPFLRRIHRDMLGNVWDWAGEYRRTQTIPGIAPDRIQTELEALCRDVLFWCSEGVELTFLEQAARIHHRLALIHPFPNGNGRFSRLVADRYLRGWRCPFPLWPSAVGRDGTERRRYIRSLKGADRGEYDLLVQYMADYGAKDPDPESLRSDPFFQKNLQEAQRTQLQKALMRRGLSERS